MASLSPTDILKEAQAGTPHSLYYLYGQDVAGVAACTAKLIKKLGVDSMSLQKLDGGTLDLEALADAVSQFSMFSQYNCILINDPPAEDWTADRVTAFLKILTDLPTATVVICNITGFDVCAGKKSPTPKQKKLIDFFNKNGVICNFEAKTPSQLAKPIMERTAKAGCSISKQNAELLAELCLCNTVMLGNELDKLCAYANGGELTGDIIRMLVAKQTDLNAFALARAVVARNGKQAFEALEVLSQDRAEPVMLLSTITSAFLDLYRAKAALAVGKQQTHILQDFSYRGRDFAVKNAIRDSGRISIEQLRCCILILRDTDAALKSSRTDGRILIEAAITRMLLAARR